MTLSSPAGGDDRRVLLWHVCHGVLSDGPTTFSPLAMRAKHNSNIFSLAFTSAADKILSAGNDQMVIVHDAKTLVSISLIASYSTKLQPSKISQEEIARVPIDKQVVSYTKIIIAF